MQLKSNYYPLPKGEHEQKIGEDPQHPYTYENEKFITNGMLASEQGKLDEAQDFFYQAERSSKAPFDPLSLARAYYHTVCDVLFYKGEFTRSLTLLSEAIRLYASQGIKYWEAHLLKAVIYNLTGGNKAWAVEMDELVTMVQESPVISSSYLMQWAAHSIDEGSWNRAAEFLKMAFQAAQQVDNPSFHCSLHLEYSRFYRLKNDPASALSWCEASRKNAQGLNAFYHGLTLMEQAQVERQLQLKEDALADLDLATCKFKEIGANFELARALFLHALWQQEDDSTGPTDLFLEASRVITRYGFAFFLQKEQETAFSLLAAYLHSRDLATRSAAEQLMLSLASIPAPALNIIGLGKFAVWKGNNQIPDKAWSRRKAGELFRFLLVQPERSATRDAIIEALWPDSESENRNDLLHQASSTARHVLEPNLPDKFPSRYIKVEGEILSLDLPEGSVVDYEQFEKMIEPAIHSQQIERVQDILRLYNDELFPEDRYFDWCAAKRELLQDLYEMGLTFLAHAYLDQKQYFSAITCCRRALKLDPWNEEAVLIGMESFVGLGNVPRAVQLYKTLEETLMADLKIRPGENLRNLARSLSQR